MNDKASEQKARYYQDPAVVTRYDSWRFGSPGGRYASTREIEGVLSLLNSVDTQASLLDLPVGTGRLSAALMQAGFENVEGADDSPAMLEASAKACGARLRLTRQNAFGTTFSDAQFDVVVSLRFVFHFVDFKPLLREYRRILKPGGVLVFDTLRWSPRTHVASLQRRLGGAVHASSDSSVGQDLQTCGFETLRSERLLLLPSLAYRAVPRVLLPAIDRLERMVPSGLRSKSLWLASKVPP